MCSNNLNGLPLPGEACGSNSFRRAFFREGVVIGRQVFDHSRDISEASAEVPYGFGPRWIEAAHPFLVDTAGDPPLQVIRPAAKCHELALEFAQRFGSSEGRCECAFCSGSLEGALLRGSVRARLFGSDHLDVEVSYV